MKKLLCFVLTLAIFVSTLSLGFSTVSAEAGSLISEGQEGLLRQLNITLSGDVIAYDKQMTRGEIAHILARAMALPEFSGTESYFYDVPMDYLYAKDIMALVDANVVHGDGNGKYRPNEPVSLGEVSKLFVGAIGFTKLEDMITYQQFANRYGITDGIDNDNVITYAEALRIAHNTLHSGMYEGHTFGENVEGDINPNYLAIERYHGLVYHRGIVNGVSGTTLTHVTEEIPKGYLRINDTIYRYDSEEILGHAVVYYVKRTDMKSNQVPVISYLYSNTELTNIFTISDEDIVGRKGKEAFVYMKGNQEREIKTVANPDVIYNGVAYPSCTDAELKPAAGSVTWIDNNGDMVYDVVSVSSYEYIVVDSINVNDTIIYGKYPNKVFGDAERETRVEMVYGLVNTYITSVKSGDVMAVKASKNDTGTLKLRLEMLPSTASAPIEGITDDTYTVGGKTYERTAATVVDSTPKLGDVVNVYTHNGKCGAILHAENDSYQYGYLLDVAEQGSAFSKQIRIRLVDQNKEIVELDLAKSVLIDETKVKVSNGNNEVQTGLARGIVANSYRDGAEDIPFAQLIRYKRNNDGLVTHIDTAYYDETKELETSLQLSFTMNYADFDVDFANASGVGEMYFFTNSRSFVNNKKGRSVFIAPALNDVWRMDPAHRNDLDYWSNADFANNGLYRKETATSLSVKPGIIEAYNIDPVTMIAEQVVFYDMGGMDVSTEINQKPGIVISAGLILDDEGMQATQITIKTGIADPVSYIIPGVSDVKVGDVVDVMAVAGKARSVRKVFSIDKKDEAQEVYSKGGQIDYYQNTRVAYGRLISYKDNYIQHTTTMDFYYDTPRDQLSNYYTYKVGTAPIFVYDSKRPDLGVREGNDTDLLTFNMDPETTQKTVISTSAGGLNFIYVIQ